MRSFEMKRLIVALVTVFAICLQAFAAAPAPTIPADIETAWEKQNSSTCQPTPEKKIEMVVYTQVAVDEPILKVVVITTLNGERISVVNLKLFMGQIPLEANSYVRKDSGWTFYDHESQEVADQMIEHERKELGITKEQYAKCFPQ